MLKPRLPDVGGVIRLKPRLPDVGGVIVLKPRLPDVGGVIGLKPRLPDVGGVIGLGPRVEAGPNHALGVVGRDLPHLNIRVHLFFNDMINE